MMARDLLIRDGLVGDQIREEAPFIRHNREIREEMDRPCRRRSAGAIS